MISPVRFVLVPLALLVFTDIYARSPEEPAERAATVAGSALERFKAQSLGSGTSKTTASATVDKLARNLDRYALDADAIEASRFVAIRDGVEQTVTLATLNDQLAAGAVLIDRVPATATRQSPPQSLMIAGKASGDVYRLDYRIRATTTEGRPIRPEVWLENLTGLIWDGSGSKFRGKFQVALTNSEDNGDDAQLRSPVPIALGAIGASEVDPLPVQISQLNRWQEVEITVVDVDGQTYRITASAGPSSDAKGATLEVPVVRPKATLQADPPSIPGWGLGTTGVIVTTRGIAAPDGVSVPLHSSAGGLLESAVTLNANGSGRDVLRSNRQKSTTVTVLSPMFDSNTLEVTFEPPWLFLALGLTGGLLGAFVAGRKRQRWPITLAIGAVTGLLMVIAWAVGLNWVSALPNSKGLTDHGEAVVLVLGFLGALLGTSALLPKRTS